MTDPLQVTAIQALEMISKGEISPVTLTELSVRKAEESKLNAFVTIFKNDAIANARESFARVRNKDCRTLEGLPIAIKDIFCIKDQLITAGSKMLSNFRPPYDSTAVRLLKEAGSVIVATTNMDEFAMGSSGKNSAYGPTLNPLDESRTPGGSSSGSAAAVASGNVFAALGSDTGGSVRLPASFCGIVGFKPSYGAISRHGLIAFSSSFDHPAIFTRTVEDARLIATVVGQECDRDATYKQVSFASKPITKLKIAYIPEQLDNVSKAIKDNFYKIIEILRNKGNIVEGISMPDVNEWLKIYYTITPAEAYSNLAKYDSIRYGSEVNAQTIEAAYRVSRDLFGPQVKKRILLGADILYNRREDLDLATHYRKSLIQRFSHVFSNFDAILHPTTADIAFRLDAELDTKEEYAQDVLTVLANIIMAPAVSIPSGFDQGMPLGLTIMCKRGNDGMALDIAEYVEGELK